LGHTKILLFYSFEWLSRTSISVAFSSTKSKANKLHFLAGPKA
jgi:hypothetical protein